MKNRLHLHVPLLNGGQMKGNLGAPEVQIFRNKPANRDLIQNPRDAWIHASKTPEERRGLAPVVVRLERIRLKTADIPCIGDIHANLGHCETSWEHLESEKKVFTNALEALQGGTVDCLKISDFNTTGAPGLDHQIHMPWYIMTRGLGVTSKGDGQGGSRGLGKVTAFLLSDIRTVFFGTMIPDGTRRFIGNVLAATFTDKGPGLPHEWQNMWLVGHQGGRSEGANSVSDPRLIPHFMERDQTGTDLLIAAHRFKRNWVAETASEIVDSWWLAIERGEVRVEIVDEVSSKPKKVVVERKTLPYLLEGDALHFHQAYTTGQREVHATKTIGDCVTRTISGPAAGGMKAFAMTRENGMQVFKRRLESNEDFCGVFECSNKTGNEVLRLMESATHDSWLKEEHPDPKAGKAAEDDYMEVIRAVRDNVNRVSDAEEDESTGLADLLPLETFEWEGPTGYRAEPTKRKRDKKTVELGEKGNRKTFEVENLVAIVADADEGEYELVVNHPTGDAAATLAVGIAGDANVVDIAEVKGAADGHGKPVGIDDNYHTIGPVRLAPGPNTIRVDIDDMRRLAVQVFQMREVKKRRRPKKDLRTHATFMAEMESTNKEKR